MWENISEIFNWVLSASLYSVAAVFIIVLTQKLMRRVLSARWIYALWLILLARLVLPAGMGLETGWSFWSLRPERLTQWIVVNTGGLDATDTATPNESIATSTEGENNSRAGCYRPCGKPVSVRLHTSARVPSGRHGKKGITRTTALRFSSRTCSS